MAKVPVIDVVCKPKSQYCDVTTLASDGGTTWGNGKFNLFRLDGASVKEIVRTSGSHTDRNADLVPPKIAAEVYALYMLFATCKVLPLCGLREGGFCTIPAQFEMDEEAVREEEWFVKKADVAFVMHAVEIFNDGGNPFILVAKDGVYAFYDDPYGYERIADDLGDFLQVLVALESAKRGATPVEKATKLLATKIHRHAGKAGYARFITRMLPGDAKVGKGTKAAASTKARVDEGGGGGSARSPRRRATRLAEVDDRTRRRRSKTHPCSIATHACARTPEGWK